MNIRKIANYATDKATELGKNTKGVFKAINTSASNIKSKINLPDRFESTNKNAKGALSAIQKTASNIKTAIIEFINKK